MENEMNAHLTGPIVAAIESDREAELERRLAEAEATIAQLRAQATTPTRKTLPTAIPGMEATALDAALASLGIEQRIAVKSELLRSGILS